MKTVRRSRSLYDARNTLISRLSAMEFYQSTHREVCGIIDELKEKYNLPQNNWRYLNGYLDCRRDSWQHAKLVHCNVMPWGEIVKTGWNEMTEEQREILRQNKAVAGGSWWLNKDGSIGRPYFVTIDIGGKGADSFREVTDAFVWGWKPILEYA